MSSSQIKIGVLAPLSGVAGFLGTDEVNAVKAYFGDVNAHGGVKGRTLVPVIADTGFDPTQEDLEARQLVTQNQVFALIALLANAEASYVTSVGIPTTAFGIVPNAFASIYPNVYPMSFNVVTAVDEMAYQLTQIEKLPIKKVAILYADQNLDDAPWSSYMAKAWEQFGVQVVANDNFNVSDANCTQEVLKVKSAGAQFWQVAQSLGWPLCQQAMAQQNWFPQFGEGGPYTADQAFVGQAGLASAGVIAMTNGVQIVAQKGQPYPFDSSGVAPAVNQYIQDFQTYSPTGDAPGSLENIWSQDFYSMAEMFTSAISHQSNAITWKGVNQWIQGQTAYSSGLVSPVDFNPTCKSGAENMWLFQWKNQGGTLVEGPISQYGGRHPIPSQYLNGVVPGSGQCESTAVADAVLK